MLIDELEMLVYELSVLSGDLASRSASSFPLMFLCPGTQYNLVVVHEPM